MIDFKINDITLYCQSCDKGVIKLKNKNGDEYMAVLCPKCLGNFVVYPIIGGIDREYPIYPDPWPTTEPWTINPTGTSLSTNVPNDIKVCNMPLSSFIGPIEQHICTGVGIGEDHKCVP